MPNDYRFYLVWWARKDGQYVCTAIETSLMEAMRSRGEATPRDIITGSDYLPTFFAELFNAPRRGDNLHGRVLG